LRHNHQVVVGECAGRPPSAVRFKAVSAPTLTAIAFGGWLIACSGAISSIGTSPTAKYRDCNVSGCLTRREKPGGPRMQRTKRWLSRSICSEPTTRGRAPLGGSRLSSPLIAYMRTRSIRMPAKRWRMPAQGTSITVPRTPFRVREVLYAEPGKRYITSSMSTVPESVSEPGMTHLLEAM